MRAIVIFALAGMLQIFGAAAAPAQWYSVPLIPRWQAEQHGLKRAWFTQIPLDRSRSKISSIMQQSGLLLVVTEDAMLHVIDAESGLIQWSYQTGDRRFLTLAAGANAKQVAVVNGATLSVLDRASGAMVFRRELTGVPERGAVLSEDRVAVPLVLGPIEVYPLNIPAEKVPYPQYMASGGRVIGYPVAYGETFVWATDTSRLRGHQFAETGIDFSVRVPGGTSTGVEVFPPYLYVGTESGFVFAYDALRGRDAWEFAAGSPIRRRPITNGAAVYVLPMDGGMFSLRPDTGQQQWFAPDPTRFVSATPDRVYSFDRYGWLVINDAKTGARLGAMQIPRELKSLANDQTDRLVLYTDDGLIQCLHEAQRETPFDLRSAEAEGETPPGAASASGGNSGIAGNVAPAQ